jgi:hypothetical protein
MVGRKIDRRTLLKNAGIAAVGLSVGAANARESEETSFESSNTANRNDSYVGDIILEDTLDAMPDSPEGVYGAEPDAIGNERFLAYTNSGPSGSRIVKVDIEEMTADQSQEGFGFRIAGGIGAVQQEGEDDVILGFDTGDEKIWGVNRQTMGNIPEWEVPGENIEGNIHDIESGQDFAFVHDGSNVNSSVFKLGSDGEQLW